MKTKTSQEIIEYLKKNKQATAKELSDYFLFSPRAIFKQLKNLIEQKKIGKLGLPPKVFYFAAKNDVKQEDFLIDRKIKSVIEDNFLFITPLGIVREGLVGFIDWCQKTKQNPIKTAKEYVKTLGKYNVFKTDGVINGLRKMKSTFKEVALNKVFYLDFYSIKRFGKTKLGQMLLYAKQSQNKKLINDLCKIIKPRIDWIIKKYHIDGVCFVPPTVKREVQFMKELQRNLDLKVKTIPAGKIKNQIAVPQKTLNKLEDRIENAKKTIFVDNKNGYNNILIIDDAIGSGATMNETAKQIKDKKLCKKSIIGLAITGSFKGFEVISEV